MGAGAGDRLPGNSTHPYLQHTPSSSSFQFETVSFTLHACFFPAQFICTIASAVVWGRSSQLGPTAWNAKRQLFLQKVSSKLGPSIRQQDRGLRPEQEPSGQGSGLTGQETHGPLADSSTLRRGASPRRTRQSQIQSLGMLLFPLCVPMKTVQVLSIVTIHSAQGPGDNEARLMSAAEGK